MLKAEGESVEDGEGCGGLSKALGFGAPRTKILLGAAMETSQGPIDGFLVNSPSNATSRR